MKKKIGIVTLHFSINYGAVLQCAALVKTLQELGNEVEVIDYVPSYLEQYWNAWKSPLNECRKQKIYCGRNIIKTFWKLSKIYWKVMWDNRNYFERRKKKQEFLQFTRDNLNIGNQHFNTLEQLKSAQLPYDCLITGSDQVWNPNFTKNKFDEVYFLRFGDRKQTRLAYAASAGVSGDTEFYMQMKNMVSKLDAISVREKSLALELKRVGIENVVPVIDPTLFLTGDDWEKYEKSTNVKEKYLLVYCLAQHKEFEEIVEKIHKEINLKIVDISPKKLNVSDCCKYDKVCGPSQFLWYIHHADFIFTNSFHGTVFSILYKKQFITLADAKTGNRMKDLLNDLLLGDRLYSENRSIASYTKRIDYSASYKELDKLRKKAEKFLVDNIGE